MPRGNIDNHTCANIQRDWFAYLLCVKTLETGPCLLLTEDDERAAILIVDDALIGKGCHGFL